MISTRVMTILLLLLPVVGLSQHWIGATAGGNFTSVSFQNSQFENHRNFSSYPGAMIAFIYQMNVPDGRPRRAFELGDMVHVKAGFKSSNLKSKTDSELTTWSFNYLTLNLGTRHYHQSYNFLSVYFGGALTTDVLVGGTLGQLYIQDKITNHYRRTNASATGELGSYFNLTDDTICAFGVEYSRGLSSIEKSSDHKAWLHSWRFSVAVIVSARKIVVAGK